MYNEGVSTADKMFLAFAGQTGSFLNMAPEVVLSQPYNEKADIFSLGCCLFEVPSQCDVIAATI